MALTSSRIPISLKLEHAKMYFLAELQTGIYFRLTSVNTDLLKPSFSLMTYMPLFILVFQSVLVLNTYLATAKQQDNSKN